MIGLGVAFGLFSFLSMSKRGTAKQQFSILKLLYFMRHVEALTRRCLS